MAYNPAYNAYGRHDAHDHGHDDHDHDDHHGHSHGSGGSGMGNGMAHGMNGGGMSGSGSSSVYNPTHGLNPLELEDAKDRAERAERRRSRLATALLDFVPKLIDFVMVMAGPLLVVIAWLLFAGIIYCYFAHVMPLLQLSAWSLPGAPLTALGLWLAFNLYYNHAMAIFTRPGGIPASVPVPHDIDALLAAEEHARRNRRRGDGFSVYCRYCRKPKPVRAHHCHICKSCVLKMDHHCPWVANCVGHNNYKYFCLFLLYLCAGCVFVTALVLPAFAWPTYLTTPPLKRAHENGAFFALILCGTASLAVGAMGGLHTYLTLTNQTTIELYSNRQQSRLAKARGEIFHNPFDLGRKKNFDAVFGVGKYWFSFLLPFRGVPGDGLFYETRDYDDDPRATVGLLRPQLDLMNHHRDDPAPAPLAAASASASGRSSASGAGELPPAFAVSVQSYAHPTVTPGPLPNPALMATGNGQHSVAIPVV